MISELLLAVKERIELGHTKASVVEELVAAGYDEAYIEQLYTQAWAEVKEGEVLEIPVATDKTFDGTPLPGAGALLADAWTYTKTNWLLSVYVAISSLVIMLIDLLLKNPAVAEQSGLVLLGALATLVAVAVYVLSVIGVLYTLQFKATPVPFSTALRWATRHVWEVLWVSVLMMLTIWGGFLLLVIPGIIVSVYLFFVQNVFIKEELRAGAALMRSRELVQGDWWSVTNRVALVVLALCGMVIVVAVAVGLLVALLVDQEGTVSGIVEVLMQCLGAVAMVVVMHVSVALYEALAAKRPAKPAAFYKLKFQYGMLMLAGVLLLCFMVVAAMFDTTKQGAFSEQQPNIDVAVLQTKLTAVEQQAQEYAVNNQSSYAGVCSELVALAEEVGEVKCNDTVDAYALSVTVDSQWCVDSSGYHKLLQVPLEERTICLLLPTSIPKTSTIDDSLEPTVTGEVSQSE